MKKIRVGVLGAYRGTSMINYCRASGKTEVVAICDKWPEALETQKKNLGETGITYYADFEDFIQHDMDAVVLANYANEHAPFAIRCLQRGLHVFSEVLPCQTMKEAVELIEAVEHSGKVYAYGENYCYMPAPQEMRRLYRAGKIGEFEYGEGEYVHNCESIWPAITYGERGHWRNMMYSTFYCTHSLGPIIHITGLRPVSVVGFEGTMVERNLRMGARKGQYGMELVTLENGGRIKSLHGGLYMPSIWYCMYGSKGRMESARYDTKAGEMARIYVNADEYSGEYGPERISTYQPQAYAGDDAKVFGHGGSDYYSMDHFIDRINGKPDADTIDVYEAMDMFLPGLFAYRSILAGGVPMEIPDLRDAAVRERYRSDTACSDPKAAGDQLLPSFSGGTPDIPDEVYQHMAELWRSGETASNYFNMAMTQGSGKKKE